MNSFPKQPQKKLALFNKCANKIYLIITLIGTVGSPYTYLSSGLRQ